jgi:hypothetical protein
VIDRHWDGIAACKALMARQAGGTLFVFVWFSNNSWLAVVVRVAAVFLIVFILVIVGVPRRHRGRRRGSAKGKCFLRCLGSCWPPAGWSQEL